MKQSPFSPEFMTDRLGFSLTNLKQLEDEEVFLGVNEKYQVRVSKFLINKLLKNESKSIRRQYLPCAEELADDFGTPDPLNETGDSPVFGLIQRYPNRVAFCLTNACAAFCRFCLRKRKIGKKDYVLSKNQIDRCMNYIKENKGIQEVIITGGDPLCLRNETLRDVIESLRLIPHVSILRISTRIPVQLPSRVDDELCRILQLAQPLYVQIHVNHADELDIEAKEAIMRIRNKGIPIVSQTVLLKGVNDDTETLRDLFESLLKIGVKPYHLYQASRVQGTSHFIVPIERAIQIVDDLWGYTSGLAIPIFVYNGEGGKGKIPLLPRATVLSENSRQIIFLNYKGEKVTYIKNVKHPVATHETPSTEAVR